MGWDGIRMGWVGIGIGCDVIDSALVAPYGQGLGRCLVGARHIRSAWLRDVVFPTCTSHTHTHKLITSVQLPSHDRVGMSEDVLERVSD